MRLTIFSFFFLFLACSSTKDSSSDRQPEYGQVIRLGDLPSDTTAFKEALETNIGSPPVLIGGLGGLRVDYPERARRNGVQGTVVVKFIVNEDGKAQNFEIIRGIGHGCDRAAIKAIERAKFEPGMNTDGSAIPVEFSLPVTFRLGI